MAVRPKTPAAAVAPAEPVPVAMLGRTSTLELQDPYGSILPQITSVKDWLPEGFYIDGFYWDIESGGLDLEKNAGTPATGSRSWPKACPAPAGWPTCCPKPIPPRPGSPPSCARTSNGRAGDTYNALKLERELGGSDILLFATDEPLDMEGTEPATILLRRTKQNMAEYFRLQLKQKMWRGMRTHAEQGYNLGKVLDGYLPTKSRTRSRTKPRTAAPKPGWPWTHARPHHRRHLRHARLAEARVPTIHGRLCADPDVYPPADPETGWTTGGGTRSWAIPKTPAIRCSAASAKASVSPRTSGTGQLSPPTPPSSTGTPGRRPSV